MRARRRLSGLICPIQLELLRITPHRYIFRDSDDKCLVESNPRGILSTKSINLHLMQLSLTT